MIAWTADGGRDAAVEDSRGCDGGPPAPGSPDDDLLSAALSIAERGTVGEALPALAHLLVARCRGQLGVLGFESPLGGGRKLLAAARVGGFDAALSAALASLDGHEVAHMLAEALPGAVLTAIDLAVGPRALCTFWLAREGAGPPPDATLLRTASMALRAAISREALEALGAMTESVQRRDRRDAIVGRLARAAAPSLVASHASLAAVQSCLAAELAEFRAVAAHRESPHAAAALLREASVFTHDTWQVVSGIACLGDDQSMSCNPSQVIQSVLALAAPYLAGRARIEVLPAHTPLVRVTPAALSEATVVLATRMAQRFVDGPGHITVAVSSTPVGAEVELRTVVTNDPPTAREQDEAMVGVFDGSFSERFGGAVTVVRDAAGGLRFRLVLSGV